MGAYIGVDEAGRGPVLGSLFVGAIAVSDPTILPAGIDDSKVLSAAERARLDELLRATPEVRTTCVEIHPRTIDDPTTSLTDLVAGAVAEAIDTLATPGDTVVADAGEADTDRYGSRVQGHLETTVDLEVRVRADATDPAVGAASIVAKEAREAHVDRLTDDYGAVGSGYPSDPTTRRFLADYVETHGELPACARASWSTCEDVLAAAAQAELDAFAETD